MFHCLKIINLQETFGLFFPNWVRGWVGRDLNWKIPIWFFFKPSLTDKFSLEVENEKDVDAIDS